MCSDDPNTIIVQTGGVNGISDLQLNGDKGTVVVEAGATFSSVCVLSPLIYVGAGNWKANCATKCVVRRGSMNAVHRLGIHWVCCALLVNFSGLELIRRLVNWNITIGGAIAMGAHRSSLREDSQVSTAAVELDIINGQGSSFFFCSPSVCKSW